MTHVVPFDVVEQILIKLGVKDLIRCKSVCKLWQRLISCRRFVRSHLNHAYNNDNNNKSIGHRRIVFPTVFPGLSPDWNYYTNKCQILGSSNGLVCISPVDAQVLVTNPSTREVKKLPTPNTPKMKRLFCWGFGYDSSIDDYKVVLVVPIKGECFTWFQLLTLKSNIWKFIGDMKYFCFSPLGTLCNGGLHWFMEDPINKKRLIMSFDLSTEEFREIPQPSDSRYVCDYDDFFKRLGIFEECLCIFNFYDSADRTWVMKSYNAWEQLPYDSPYDLPHYQIHDVTHELGGGYYVSDICGEPRISPC